MIIEYSDIKQFMPRLKMDIVKEVREEIEKDTFIRYPKGLMEHYGGMSKSAVWRLYTHRHFPRVEVMGVKGVYLSDLRKFESEVKLKSK